MTFREKIDLANTYENIYQVITDYLEAWLPHTTQIYNSANVEDEMSEPIDISTYRDEATSTIQSLIDSYKDRFQNNWIADNGYKTKLMFLNAADGVNNDIYRRDEDSTVEHIYLENGTISWDSQIQDGLMEEYVQFFDDDLNDPFPDSTYTLGEFMTIHTNIVTKLEYFIGTINDIFEEEDEYLSQAMALISAYAYVSVAVDSTGTFGERIDTITPGLRE